MTDPSSLEPPADGRRDNGLSVQRLGCAGRRRPRLSDGLLASLAAAGVAAYVEPAHGSHSLTRAATLPDRPLDRLWVGPRPGRRRPQVIGTEVAQLTALLAEQDPGATAHGLVQPVPRTAARRVLTPPSLPARPQPPAEPARLDDDEEFRRIVEGFSREDESPVPPWPVSEDVDPPARRPFPRRPERPSAAEPSRRRTDPPGDGLPGWVEPEAVEDEGHYEPPPPPPVPRLAPRKLAAVAAVVVGVLLMFAPKLLLQDRTAFVLTLGLLLTAGGAGVLVYLMRDAPPRDSGPDDGAVV
jgi:hypothetical protein